MLQNGILLVICFVSEISVQTVKPFMLKLTPEQVMQTFDGVMSDDYIKILAKDFAAKAASHFMKEIRHQKDALVSKLNTKHQIEQYRMQAEQQKDDSNTEIADFDNKKSNIEQTELDEKEALSLIHEPSPDGDHLESSGEFSDKEKIKIPVIQVTKINGVYYRRLLGVI